MKKLKYITASYWFAFVFLTALHGSVSYHHVEERTFVSGFLACLFMVALLQTIVVGIVWVSELAKSK